MTLSAFISTARNIMRGDAGIDGDAQRIAQLTWLLFLKVYDAKEEEWELYDGNYQSIIPETLRWRNWAVDKKDGRSMTGAELLDFVNDDLFPGLKALPVGPNTPLRQSIVKSVFEDSNQYSVKDGVLLRQLINIINEIDFHDYKERHAFGEIYETLLKELQSAGSSGEFYTPRAVTDFMVQMVDPRLGESVADFAAGTAGFLTSTSHLQTQVKSVEDGETYRKSVYGIEKKAMPYFLGVTNLLLHDVDSPQYYHDNSLLRNVRDYKDNEKFDVILMNPPYGGKEQDSVKANFPANYRSSETADLFVALITYRLKRHSRAGVVLPDGFLFGNDNAKHNLKKRLLEEFNLHTIIRLPGSVFSPYTSIATNLLFFDADGPTKQTWFYRVDLPEGYKAFSKTRPLLTEHSAGAAEWWHDRREIIDAEGNPKAEVCSPDQIAAGDYNLDLCGFPQENQIILSPEETIADYKAKRAELDTQIDAKIAEIEAILAVKV